MGSFKFDRAIDNQKGMELTGSAVRTVHEDTDTVCKSTRLTVNLSVCCKIMVLCIRENGEDIIYVDQPSEPVVSGEVIQGKHGV